jgi:hypothetical protein
VDRLGSVGSTVAGSTGFLRVHDKQCAAGLAAQLVLVNRLQAGLPDEFVSSISLTLILGQVFLGDLAHVSDRLRRQTAGRVVARRVLLPANSTRVQQGVGDRTEVFDRHFPERDSP